MATKRQPTREPEYDASVFPRFAVTVDIVILTIRDGELCVLLVKRRADPYAGRWALPGGFKTPTETLDQAARRELREETGIRAPAHLAQLKAYGDPDRDPRPGVHVVTVAYLAVVRDLGEPTAGTDAADAKVVPVARARASRLAFDHAKILGDAVERVRADLEQTGLAASFVGESFTLSELRTVFETVWETSLDPANFRRSLLGGDETWVEPTGERSPSTRSGGRPPEKYRATGVWQAYGAPLRRPRSRPDETSPDH